jgi:hypothetical protein
MKRRKLLQSVAALPLAPAALSQTPAATPAQTSTQEGPPEFATIPPGSVGQAVPRFFTSDQFKALEWLADLLMPAVNERPGAKQAGAAQFLDFLISQSPPERQQLYRNGLDRLHREGFSEAVLNPLTASWTYDGPRDEFAQFLLAAKEDVMRATYNSREFAAAMSQVSRGFSGSGYYWTTIE